MCESEGSNLHPNFHDVFCLVRFTLEVQEARGKQRFSQKTIFWSRNFLSLNMGTIVLIVFDFQG